jgi:hypothetical protein
VSTEVVVAILSALFGFLTWRVQRFYERLADERRRKEDLYGALLTASIELIATGDGAPFVIESQRAWLYASDEVLERINDYLAAYADYGEALARGVSTTTRKPSLRAEALLRLAIRKDIRPKTGISADWVTKQWTTIISRPERVRRYLGRESVEANTAGVSSAEDGASSRCET